MELKPGSRWRSAAGAGEVVVVRPPKSPTVLECGGHPMIPFGHEPVAGLAITAAAEGLKTGKRYSDEETGLEVLCSKGGEGALSAAGRPLRVAEAKKLPSSD